MLAATYALIAAAVVCSAFLVAVAGCAPDTPIRRYHVDKMPD